MWWVLLCVRIWFVYILLIYYDSILTSLNIDIRHPFAVVWPVLEILFVNAICTSQARVTSKTDNKGGQWCLEHKVMLSNNKLIWHMISTKKHQKQHCYTLASDMFLSLQNFAVCSWKLVVECFIMTCAYISSVYHLRATDHHHIVSFQCRAHWKTQA